MTISKVQECIVVANTADQSCAGKPPTPAAQSGIQPGDKIVAFNGTPVSSWDDVSRLIRSNLDHPALLKRRARRSAHRSEAGQYGHHRDTGQVRPIEARRRRVLCVEPEIVRERGGPVAVVGDMWQMTKQTVVALAYFPVKVFYTGYNLVTGKPRDVYGPMSIVGASRAAGEIASTNQIT